MKGRKKKKQNNTKESKLDKMKSEKRK